MRKRRVALVTQDMAAGGGVATMTSFLHSVLQRSGEWLPEIITLATSARDANSVRLGRPSSWRCGVQITPRQWRGVTYQHVGAHLAEIEVQRYRPRSALDRLLESYDLVQFVMGSAAPVCVAANVRRPRLLWTATTMRADRASRLRASPLPKRLWSAAMLHWAEKQERQGLQLSDTIFALSTYTTDSLKRMVHGRRVELAPCGVDTELFRPGKLADDYIMCVARFYDARKNIHLLLRAYAVLQDRLAKSPRLLLVGEPPTHQAIELLHELGIAGKVEMIEAQSPQRLAQLYQGAKLFALSSDEEGLGIVILEAMSSGLPIVSTACGGPNMLVEDGINGFLTPVADVSALAVALQRVLENPRLAREMGRRSRELADRRFSIESAGGVFLRRYEDIIDRSTA